MDGRLKGNCGRCEGSSGKGSYLVPKFIVTEDDEATAVTREGMLNGERCVTAITGCREVGRGKAIMKVDGVTKFQRGEDGVGCDGRNNGEPSAS